MIPFNTCMLDFTSGTMQGIRKYESKHVHSDWKDCLNFSVGILHTLFHKPLKPTVPLFVATGLLVAVQFCDIRYMSFFPWKEYVFSEPKANLVFPALSLGLANDCISFRILPFSRGHCFGQYLGLFCSGTGLPQCTRQQWSKYKAIIPVNLWKSSLSPDTFEINTSHFLKLSSI